MPHPELSALMKRIREETEGGFHDAVRERDSVAHRAPCRDDAGLRSRPRLHRRRGGRVLMAGESGITIDHEERDGLYELVRNHLGSIEDFWVALERTKNFAAVERIGKEFAEDFRLLEDIGWGEYEARETYVLTMPAPELRKLLWRLRDEVAQVLIEHGEEAESTRRDAETARRFQIGHQTCEKVSGNLDSPHSK
jgi:hypothetical protein